MDDKRSDTVDGVSARVNYVEDWCDLVRTRLAGNDAMFTASCLLRVQGDSDSILPCICLTRLCLSASLLEPYPNITIN